ncbi:MAG: class I SAM-dependent methyltransferase [Bacteroidales bacterium]|nr:class I SAM-dependent methyltransferase [Candidatus Physcocola equi]
MLNNKADKGKQKFTLETYYNKHKEDLRLQRRHGMVEFRVSMKFIHDLLPNDNKADFKILDLGAATGNYTIPLYEEGYDVTAVELVKHNVDVLKSKNSNVKAFQGTATDLRFLPENSFDMVINFGPLYHLIKYEDRLKAMAEIKRVTKDDGVVLNAYVLNDYSLLTYCFKENRMSALVKSGAIDEDFHIHSAEDELYVYARMEDLEKLNSDSKLERLFIFSPDGPSDFMRPVLNAMSDEDFEIFVQYQMKNALRPELLGAGSHLVDVVKVHK